MRGPPWLGVNLVLSPIIAETVRWEQRGPSLLSRHFSGLEEARRPYGKGFWPAAELIDRMDRSARKLALQRSILSPAVE